MKWNMRPVKQVGKSGEKNGKTRKNGEKKTKTQEKTGKIEKKQLGLFFLLPKVFFKTVFGFIFPFTNRFCSFLAPKLWVKWRKPQRVSGWMNIFSFTKPFFCFLGTQYF